MSETETLAELEQMLCKAQKQFSLASEREDVARKETRIALGALIEVQRAIDNRIEEMRKTATAGDWKVDKSGPIIKDNTFIPPSNESMKIKSHGWARPGVDYRVS
jgi:IS30 family transposase